MTSNFKWGEPQKNGSDMTSDDTGAATSSSEDTSGQTSQEETGESTESTESHGGHTGQSERISPNPSDFQGLGLPLGDRPQQQQQQQQQQPHSSELCQAQETNRTGLPPTAWNHNWTVEDTAQLRSSSHTRRSDSMLNHASQNTSARGTGR